MNTIIDNTAFKRTPGEKRASSKYPRIWKNVRSLYPDLPWQEALYLYVHGETQHFCECCGSPTKFRNFTYGYNQFCSTRCAAAGTTKKRERTCMERYGVSNPTQSTDIIEKRNHTNQQRYGGVGFKSEVLREKFAITYKKRTGYVHPNQNPVIKQRIANTNKQRYGILPMIDVSKQKVLDEHQFIISTNGREWTCKCPHPECNGCTNRTYVTHASIQWNRSAKGTEVCTNLLPISEPRTSGTSLELFVRSVLDESGVKYVCNDRPLISSREVDICVPSKHIAFECNGLFWHSDYSKSRKYHFEKWSEYNQKDVQLVQVWEDWIKNKPDIIRSIIRSKLGLYDIRIQARKADIREVDHKTARNFLQHNHLQGATTFIVAIGLYSDNELVALMTFGRKRGCSGNKSDEGWDLSRFCAKIGYQVLGGAGKCLKYFEKHYHPETIYSYSMNDISDGGLYKSLGFESSNVNRAYWYVDPVDLKRYHRSTFTKARIKARGWAPTGSNWTEKEIMDQRGYLRIYDSGTTKWIKRL